MAKRRKKMTKQAKRRLILFGSICLICVVSFVSSVFSYAINLYSLSKEKENLQAEYIVLQQDAENLKIEISKLQNPEYLAKFARENYLYSKDGELIIKINENKKEEITTSIKAKTDQMIVTLSLIAVGLIFLYILIRSTKKRNQNN